MIFVIAFRTVSLFICPVIIVIDADDHRDLCAESCWTSDHRAETTVVRSTDFAQQADGSVEHRKIHTVSWQDHKVFDAVNKKVADKMGADMEVDG